METVESSRSDGSLLRYEIFHGLLWFGFPMMAWSTYDWWRDKEISSFTGSRAGDLAVAIIGDLLAALLFSLIFFGIVGVLRNRRLRKHTQ